VTCLQSGNLESWCGQGSLCLVHSIRTDAAFTDISCSCGYVTQRILGRTAVNIPESLTTLEEEEVSAFFNMFHLPNCTVPDSLELICLVRWLANVLNLGNGSCRLNNCLSNCPMFFYLPNTLLNLKFWTTLWKHRT
jgi:hypothetical protein